MSEFDPIVQVAIVGGATTILVTILGGIGWIGRQLYTMRKHTASLKSDTRETLHQVKNDHTVNLRDDFDRKHEIVMREVSSINKRLNGHLDRFNSMDQRDARIEDMLAYLITGKGH